ncbi:MAG: PD40 domain-containing protein [Chloroflexi bacterium]|nr:PD40 domain-containing protein [Chloroflexota bacterium]
MERRSNNWLVACILLVVVGALGLLCVGTVAVGGFFWLQRNSAEIITGPLPANPLPAISIPAPPPAPPAINRIVYTGNDGNIYTVLPDGTDRVGLTSDAHLSGSAGGVLYSYPAWSRNSERVAYVMLQAEGQQNRAALLTISALGGDPQEVYVTNRGDGTPYYLYWAPDNQHIGFLTQEQSGSALRIAAGSEETLVIDRGAPLYFSWSPDANNLLLHVGGDSSASEARISLGTLQTPSPNHITETPALFLAPAFSPDGESMLYATAEGRGSSSASRPSKLILADEQGQQTQTLLDYQGAIAFQWSPDSQYIAFSVTSDPGSLGMGIVNYAPIKVMKRDGSEQRHLSEEDALAFFWSPDGKYLAYLAPDLDPQNKGMHGEQYLVSNPAQRIQVAWKIVELATGDVTRAALFNPTAAFIEILPYFDQYAQSVTFWSPDSQKLVYTSRDASGGPAQVYVTDIGGKSLPVAVGDGDLAFWSWR